MSTKIEIMPENRGVRIMEFFGYVPQRLRKSKPSAESFIEYSTFSDNNLKLIDIHGSPRVEGASYYNSLELMKMYGEEYEKAQTAAKAEGYEVNTSEFQQFVLRRLFKDSELELVHTISGNDMAKGTYFVWGVFSGINSEG